MQIGSDLNNMIVPQKAVTCLLLGFSFILKNKNFCHRQYRLRQVCPQPPGEEKYRLFCLVYLCFLLILDKLS